MRPEAYHAAREGLLLIFAAPCARLLTLCSPLHRLGLRPERARSAHRQYTPPTDCVRVDSAGSQDRCDHSPLVRCVPELGEVDACPTHVDQLEILRLRRVTEIRWRADVTLAHPSRIFVTAHEADGVGSIVVRNQPSTHLARYLD